ELHGRPSEGAQGHGCHGGLAGHGQWPAARRLRPDGAWQHPSGRPRRECRYAGGLRPHRHGIGRSATMAGAAIISEFKKRVEKTLADLRRELSKIRTGRASASMLDGIQVDSYGMKMPLNAVATITVADARTIVLKPFDKSQIGAIEKAILESDIGVTPQNDGAVVRLPFPPLTEERRK